MWAARQKILSGEIGMSLPFMNDSSLTAKPAPAPIAGQKIRVLLADDHALFRQGLRQLLELEEEIEVIGDAADGEEAQQLVRQLRPDVVLMDINMPDVDGITATRAILSEFPRTSVVILTM